MNIIKLMKNVFKKQNQKNKPTSYDKEAFDRAFEEFNNRKTYKVVNSEILKSIPDEKLIQAIIDYIADEIINGNWKEQYKLVKALPIGFQHVYGIFQLEAEVNNGGFNQFFFNSSSLFIDEVYNGCMAIGATKTAKVVEKAVEIIMNEMEMQKKTREIGTIEAFMQSYEDTKLGICDDEFYKYSEDLQGLCIKYIRNNYIEFERTNA